MPYRMQKAPSLSEFDWQGTAREAMAGLVVFAVQLVQAASFLALIFQSEAKSGFGVGLWSAMVGVAIVGTWISYTTTMKPLAAGPDTPALAVSAAVAGTIASQVSGTGLSGDEAARHILIALTLTTVIGGAAMFALGALKLGQSLRFIPNAVVAGFLGATGWLVMLGGVKLLTGRPMILSLFFDGLSATDAGKLLVAVVFALCLLHLRKIIKSPFFIPLMVVGVSMAFAAALWNSPQRGNWYLGGGTGVSPWLPWRAFTSREINWGLLATLLPELLTVVIVSLISMVVKIATLENVSGATADFDREFKAHGIANLICAPFGGLSMSVGLSPTRIARDAGARDHRFALFGAAFVVVFLLTRIDVMALVPAPVLAGILIFLGYSMLSDALRAPLQQRAWIELGVALAILMVCVTRGYIFGVLAGLVASCLIFAFSYSRIGVIRRHLTRADFAGGVTRASEEAELLKAHGNAIQLYWLSGYLFFGSSEQVFERVKAELEVPTQTPIRFVILDFSDVPGADATARGSLGKLRTYCQRRGVGVVFAGLPDKLRAGLSLAGIMGPDELYCDFPAYEMALQWCEERVLDGLSHRASDGPPLDIEAWLVKRFGGKLAAEVLQKYLVKVEAQPGDVIYRAGAASDSIDIVASGVIDIEVPGSHGARGVVRRMLRETVIGEMGYFRGIPRTATVSAEAASTLFCLRRENFQRLEAEQPWLALAVYRFIIEELSHRLELSNDQARALR